MYRRIIDIMDYELYIEKCETYRDSSGYKSLLKKYVTNTILIPYICLFVQVLYITSLPLPTMPYTREKAETLNIIINNPYQSPVCLL